MKDQKIYKCFNYEANDLRNYLPFTGFVQFADVRRVCEALACTAGDDLSAACCGAELR
jgi:hypothetical protein